LTKVVELDGGELVASGRASLTGVPVESAILLSLERDGAPRWEAELSHSDGVSIEAMVADDEGGVVVAGDLGRGDASTSEAATWLARFDREGSRLWQVAVRAPDAASHVTGLSRLDDGTLLVNAEVWEQSLGEEHHLVFGLDGGLRRGFASSLWVGDLGAHAATVTRAGVIVVVQRDPVLGLVGRGTPIDPARPSWASIIAPPELSGVNPTALLALDDGAALVVGWENDGPSGLAHPLLAVIGPEAPDDGCEHVRPTGEVLRRELEAPATFTPDVQLAPTEPTWIETEAHAREIEIEPVARCR
jgi:hypothetical protein